MKQQRSTGVKVIEGKKQALYDFVCPGCDCAGELGVPLDTHNPFGCPEECGASYVQTKDLQGQDVITCVVCPIF